jgi:hypothetical protein
MTQRYAHLSPDNLREAVERLDVEPAAARKIENSRRRSGVSD